MKNPPTGGRGEELKIKNEKVNRHDGKLL